MTTFFEHIQQILQTLINNITIHLSAHSSEYQPAISIFGIILAMVLLMRVRRTRRLRVQKNDSLQTFNKKDMEMLSGEDVVTTQLDLARAYIEMGKKHLAKSILYHVRKQGKPEQQQEARNLIKTL
jgi:FimV-like protein